MSLTHVCMWSSHGWKRITEREAAQLHPGGTVSAKSGLFMCELCGQYVTLTDGWIRDRYFKHSAEELSKDCPERTFSSSVPVTYSYKTHDLPLRLRIISTGKFELQLGLLPVPEKLLQNKHNSRIIIGFPDGQYYNYSFERILTDTMTYLSVGERPYKKYTITIDPTDSGLIPFWPRVIDGISESGTLFDSVTGKKLSYDADTIVNHKYHLLSSHKLYFDNISGITARQICRRDIEISTWYVYEIEATSFDESTARFFLDYHCRLTENAVSIIPLWPVYIETPYRICHNKDQITFFLRGDAEPQVFPKTNLHSSSCDNGKFFTVNCHERQQILSAGRTKVLKYTYLWKDDLDYKTPLPQIIVTDLSGMMITPGEHKELPAKKTIRINAAFDGYVLRKKKGIVLERLCLSSGETIEIDDVQYGHSIFVLQGLDTVWSCYFVHTVTVDDEIDDSLFIDLRECKGEYITLDHSVGALAAKMGDYPKTKGWLYTCIRCGRIPRKAYNILIDHFS